MIDSYISNLLGIEAALNRVLSSLTRAEDRQVRLSVHRAKREISKALSSALASDE